MDILKYIAPQDNEANMTNDNAGTSGFNQQYLQAQENRRRQLAQARRFFDPPSLVIGTDGDGDDEGGMIFDGGGD